MTDLSATGSRIIVRIRRQDGPGLPARWEEFHLTAGLNLNVISCLKQIAAHPIMSDGRPTTSPVWEDSCLEEMCGACTMIINGKPRQACSALVGKLGAPQEPIVLEPLTKFPIVRDLLVDRKRMFDDLKRIKAWVPVRSADDSGPGPTISKLLQEKLYDLSRCISCGACLEVCPKYLPGNNFVGAAIFSQALRFNSHPSGKRLAPKRLEALTGRGGITDCDTTGNCSLACPKEISHANSIDAISRSVREQALKNMKSSRRSKRN